MVNIKTEESAEAARVALRAEHASLERRLAEIEGHLYLSAEAQLERARLKKQKLLIKDRLAALGG